MGDFFHGWRRKIGLLTLVMACGFMVGWLACYRPHLTFQINTEAPGFSAADVKSQITIPIEVYLAGLPGADSVLVASEPGLSVFLITFNGRIDATEARQSINFRLEQFDAPPGCSPPKLVPISTKGLHLEKSTAYQ